MSKKIDLVGQTFARLRVLSRNEEVSKQRKQSYFNCICECGNRTVVWSNHLRNGRILSCGCYNSDLTTSKNLKHGDSKRGHTTRIYSIWKGIKSRCYYAKHIRYKDYGGRGIAMCEQWLEYDNFKQWAISNGYSEHLTIDRIDSDKNYEPSNCRWVSYEVQGNNRRKTREYLYCGELKTMRELSNISGISYKVLRDRIERYHWDINRAVSTPIL